MKGFLKFLLLVTVLLVLLVGIPAYGLYHLFFVADQITLQASDGDGQRVCLSIPARVISLAAGLARPQIVIEPSEIEELEQWKPAIAAIISELDKHPDLPIVEVSTDGDVRVRIVKQNGKLRLFVDSREGDQITIDVPAHVVSDAVRDLTDL